MIKEIIRYFKYKPIHKIDVCIKFKEDIDYNIYESMIHDVLKSLHLDEFNMHNVVKRKSEYRFRTHMISCKHELYNCVEFRFRIGSRNDSPDLLYEPLNDTIEFITVNGIPVEDATQTIENIFNGVKNSYWYFILTNSIMK